MVTPFLRRKLAAFFDDAMPAIICPRFVDFGGHPVSNLMKAVQIPTWRLLTLSSYGQWIVEGLLSLGGAECPETEGGVNDEGPMRGQSISESALHKVAPTDLVV